LHVDVAVGDFDSLDADLLAGLERAGARLVRYPVEKDASDLELALEAAVSFRPARILVVGSSSGRGETLGPVGLN